MMVIRGASAINQQTFTEHNIGIGTLTEGQRDYTYAIPTEFRFDATLGPAGNQSAHDYEFAPGTRVTRAAVGNIAENVQNYRYTVTGLSTTERIVGLGNPVVEYGSGSSRLVDGNARVSIRQAPFSATSQIIDITLSISTNLPPFLPGSLIGEPIVLSFTPDIQTDTPITGAVFTIDDDGVINVNVPASTVATGAAGLGSPLRIDYQYEVPTLAPGGYDVLYPADRCVWSQHQHDSGRGYYIGNAFFYPGNAAREQINLPELGYVGKSGRFVKIAD